MFAYHMFSQLDVTINFLTASHCFPGGLCLLSYINPAIVFFRNVVHAVRVSTDLAVDVLLMLSRLVGAALSGEGLLHIVIGWHLLSREILLRKH